jgi:hypothetical protein
MVECLEKIDDAEDEKGNCPTKGDFEKLAWSHTLERMVAYHCAY